jgi:hypothetical protein
MQASIGQYSIQAGEPAQPVQQSVVMASILGFFLRVALPSPADIGQCFSMISIMQNSLSGLIPRMMFSRAAHTLTRASGFAQ